MHEGLAEILTSVKHQQMVTLYPKCILHQTLDRSSSSLNDTMVFMQSTFETTFELSQEARKVQQSLFNCL